MTDAPRDLVTLVRRATTRHASRPLFAIDRDGGWSRYTFADLAREEVRLRASLARLGVRPGDRVAIISKNREEWAVVLAATHALGAAIVPMYEMQHVDDWRHILHDAKARVCFASTDVIYARVRGLLGDLPISRTSSASNGARASTRTIRRFAISSTRAPRRGAARHAEPGRRGGVHLHLGNDRQTEGGEAKPRLAGVRDERDQRRVGPRPGDRTVSILPWAHVGGFGELVAGIHLGFCAAVPSSFDKLAEAIRATRPTVIIAVPRVWNALYDAIHKGMAARPPALRWVWKPRSGPRRSAARGFA